MSSIQVSNFYQLEGPAQLVLKRKELTLPDAQEIIAKTLYSAISPGTEVAAYAGLAPLRPGNPYPRVVGYCNVARVEQTGTNVENVSVGDLILTFQSHRDYFKCSAREVLLKLSPDDNVKIACVVYLFHLGYSALLSADCKPGQYVVVIGAGTLGYTSCVISQFSGCDTSVFTNQNEIKSILEARKVRVFDRSAEHQSKFIQFTGMKGADVVINTSNTWEDWLLALQLARKGGTIVNLGFPGRGLPLPSFNPLDSQYLYDKHLTIKSAGYISDHDVAAEDIRFTIRRNMAFIHQMIRNGRIDAETIISEIRPYTDLETIYKRIAQRNGKFFTAVLEW